MNKNISWLQRVKAVLQVMPIALDALDVGDLSQAAAAIQISGLSAEQYRHGCLCRLSDAYNDVNGYGPKRRVSKDLLKVEYEALDKRGQAANLQQP